MEPRTQSPRRGAERLAACRDSGPARTAGGAIYLWLRPAPGPALPEPRYEVPKTIAYEFWTQAPVRQTATQRCCERLETSIPFETETDAAGNQVLHVRLAPIPPYAVRVIRVTAELHMARAPNRLPDNPAEHEPLELQCISLSVGQAKRSVPILTPEQRPPWRPHP
jgi:hypothetical protein